MHPSETDNLYERLSPSERMAIFLGIYQSFPPSAYAQYNDAVQQEEELTRKLEGGRVSLDEYLKRSKEIPDISDLWDKAEKINEARSTSLEKAETTHNLRSLLSHAPISNFFRSELINQFDALYDTGVDHRPDRPSQGALSQYDWILKQPDLDSAQRVNFFEGDLAPKVERIAFLKYATGQDLFPIEQLSRQTFAEAVESGVASIKEGVRKNPILEEMKRSRPVRTAQWAESFQAKHGFNPKPSR